MADPIWEVLPAGDIAHPVGAMTAPPAAPESCGIHSSRDYAEGHRDREVNWVEIDLGQDDHNHLIKPEDRVNLAMAVQ